MEIGMNLSNHQMDAPPMRALTTKMWVLPYLAGIFSALLASATIEEVDPFATVERALQLRQTMTDAELEVFLQDQVRATQNGGTTSSFLLIAELMKQVGDYRAGDYFQHTILNADEEPAYDLLYADYLRNVRGPQRPLFEEAEKHYLEALRKIERQQSPSPWSAEVRERALRGLVVLYQEDGIPIAWREDTKPQVPFLFFSSIARTARSTADLDEIHDVRDWTAEALFSASAVRLNRPLSHEELSGLIRRKEATVLDERLRYRVHGAAIDLSCERRGIQNAQITSFLQPNNFNRVQVDNLGAEIAIAFDEAPSFDGYLRQAFHLVDRQGLIEFQPRATERVLQSETEVSWSRFAGSNKVDLNLTYVAQKIWPQIPNPPRRERGIVAARLNYQILRPLRLLRNPFRSRFAARGLHIFGGIADDREFFGAVEVRRDDFFVGTTLNGLGPFDVTLQPTIFRERVAGDRSQTSSQLRLDGILVLRLVDEEKNPGVPKSILGLHPAFVHLVVPVKRDRAVEGLSAFENERIGIGVDTKFFVMRLRDLTHENTTRFSTTTLLLSGHYFRQRFPRLDKRVNLFELNLSLGF
jgi:hypothetical protein